jgi:hypothetical protein
VLIFFSFIFFEDSSISLQVLVGGNYGQVLIVASGSGRIDELKSQEPHESRTIKHHFFVLLCFIELPGRMLCPVSLWRKAATVENSSLHQENWLNG